MKTKSIFKYVMGLLVCGSAVAETVSFSSPGAWLSERSDNLVAKVQLDTSRIPQKKIEMVLSKVESGKKKTISSKTFQVTDYAQEFNLGATGTSLIGGKDFLRIDWTIPGTKEKGNLFPIGVVQLEKIGKIIPLEVTKSKVAVDEKNWVSIASAAKFISLKGNDFSLIWDEKALVVIGKKLKSKNSVQFAFDCKNGKNAFLSFPDRIFSYNLSIDSLSTKCFERIAVSDSVSYLAKSVNTEVKVYGDEKQFVIVVPWFDLGMLPAEDRVIGFAAFITDEKEKVTAAFPEKAKMLIPGSWSNAVLNK